MKIRNIFSSKKEEPKQEVVSIDKLKLRGNGQLSPEGSYMSYTLPSRFDGEKEKGDIGLVRNYKIDYTALSKRVNEAMLVDDIAKAVVGRYTKWIVSKGLELEYKPKKKILELNGVSTEKIEELNDIVEAYFDMWAKSKDCSFRRKENFYQMQKYAFKSAIANSDILTVLRYSKKKGVTVELIDSQRLVNPDLSNLSNEDWKNGVRYDSNGEVVEFCVKAKNDLGYVKIKARNSQGILQAFLFKMDRHSIEEERGLSKLSGSLNKLSKLDRYIEATVGSAEERAKVAFSIEHDIDSSGENPLQLVKASRGVEDSDDDPIDRKGDQLADIISATTGKQTYNMTQGSKLVMHDFKIDTDSVAFTDNILSIVSASVGIPPDVVKMMYNGSFSASRAAIKDWQHTMTVDREEFMRGWLLPIFVYWLRVESAKDTIHIPAYVNAIQNGNKYLIKAYENVEFVGETFPHIDPVKEVRAERAKLGPRYRNVPLTTHERATRALGNSDSGDVIQQTTDEIERFKMYDEGMERIEVRSRQNPSEISE